MTTLNGVVGIDFNLTAIVACTSLSSQRAVLIHQFDDRIRSLHPFTRQAAARSVRNLLLRAPVRQRRSRFGRIGPGSPLLVVTPGPLTVRSVVLVRGRDFEPTSR